MNDSPVNCRRSLDEALGGRPRAVTYIKEMERVFQY